MTLLLNDDQIFYSTDDICELDTRELALIREPNREEMLKPNILVFCKFLKKDNKTMVNFYNEPFEVKLTEDNTRKMKKIINNQTQIEQINRMIEERKIL